MHAGGSMNSGALGQNRVGANIEERSVSITNDISFPYLSICKPLPHKSTNAALQKNVELKN